MKSGIWVQATVRRCTAEGIMCTVARRGDADAGVILLKLNRFEQGCTVLSQSRSASGELVWTRGTGANPVTEPEADAYIARQVGRDPDLWVVEIEDRQNRNPFEGRIV
ncbi:MAG TPA: DUF1491 family protein [Candidatus Cybelea sp.]|nr:DUF1491 family protein [Candidatus Cybelea sp.]